jgi:hypothetical protein
VGKGSDAGWCSSGDRTPGRCLAWRNLERCGNDFINIKEAASENLALWIARRINRDGTLRSPPSSENVAGARITRSPQRQ